VHVLDAGTLSSAACNDALSDRVVPELKKASRALIAIDAPLGWPAAMSVTLVDHQAGGRIGIEPDRLFHRATDDFVSSRLGKRPLEVGANLIARTAHSALRVLAKLREQTEHAIPLTWDPAIEGIAAIEVYPAASLIAWGCALAKYKEDARAREDIAQRLAARIAGIAERALDPVDAFDACLCLLAAQDFLEGMAWPPEDRERAIKEGWIWVRRMGE
jgi:predicted nuclease with RNAse H fold